MFGFIVAAQAEWVVLKSEKIFFFKTGDKSQRLDFSDDDSQRDGFIIHLYVYYGRTKVGFYIIIIRCQIDNNIIYNVFV